MPGVDLALADAAGVLHVDRAGDQLRLAGAAQALGAGRGQAHAGALRAASSTVMSSGHSIDAARLGELDAEDRSPARRHRSASITSACSAADSSSKLKLSSW